MGIKKRPCNAKSTLFVYARDIAPGRKGRCRKKSTWPIEAVYAGIYLKKNTRDKPTRNRRDRGMNGLGNVIRGPVIMTPLITDNYCSYRARGVISAGPSRAAVEKSTGADEGRNVRELTGKSARDGFGTRWPESITKEEISIDTLSNAPYA